VAKVAKKTWPWPGLPGFTKPHFPGKLGQKPGKPGLARLCEAGRVFDQAPDAREVLEHFTESPQRKKSLEMEDCPSPWEMFSSL